MPYGLVSNLNVAFRSGFQEAVRGYRAEPLDFIENCLFRKHYSSIVSGLSSKVRRFSSNKCNGVMTTALGSLTSSTDFVADSLVAGCGNLSSFVKPNVVYFNYGGYRNCQKARVSLRTGVPEEVRGRIVLELERRPNHPRTPFYSSLSNCSFTSLCYSDRVIPDASTDESLNAGKFSSFALSAEPTPNHSVLKLLSGACYLPHPAKEETGGEDAHFICVDEQAIGVADGVGGWADVGVNAGLYARELMANSVKAIREVPNGSIDPLFVLEKAHAATKALGSSTACIINLKNQGLHAINLGDSGFIVVREGETVFASPTQQHGFNFTFQLENSSRGDQPSSGQVFEIPAVPGDIIVAGSDGLFDNLYSKEIAAVVADAIREGLRPDATAHKIAAFARHRALDRRTQSPFAAAAQEAGYAYYGGKLDDITVVVSYISW